MILIWFAILFSLINFGFIKYLKSMPIGETTSGYINMYLQENTISNYDLEQIRKKLNSKKSKF